MWGVRRLRSPGGPKRRHEAPGVVNGPGLKVGLLPVRVAPHRIRRSRRGAQV